MSELETGFRIGDLVAVVRRRLPLVAGAALVGLVAGYLVFASASATYSATSRVQVEPIRLNPFQSDGKDAPVDIATEKDLVKSDAVADHIREELGLQGENKAILGRVVVSTEPDSLVLMITFEGDNAAMARDGANATAEGYLIQRRETASGDRDRALQKVDGEIASATTALTEAQAAYDAAPEGAPERSQLRTQVQTAQSQLGTLQQQRTQLAQFDPDTVGSFVRKASLPSATTSKKALGMGVGVFGLFTAAGFGAALLLDRRDDLSGGKRRIESLVPGANVRMIPGADGSGATPAEVDTAIDRLAVELVAGHQAGRATSAMVISAGMEPPVALAEELASSLAFAGIPALFVLAGSSSREPRQSHAVASFADLVTAPGSIAGPLGLPSSAGDAGRPAGQTVAWLRPTGSAEAGGLLRRAVVESLVARAGREHFEAVIFVAPSPTRTAAGAALGQWVDRTAVIIERDERGNAEAAVEALAGAGVRVTEVVFT